jgi:cell division protein YceG involved in septum cleavage
MNNNFYSGKTSTERNALIRRICALVLPLIFFSFVASALIISVANDMYAFVKPKNSATISIEAESTVYQTARILEDNGIINNPAAFTLYVISKDARERISSFSGEIYLSSTMSYREILRSFSKSE